MPATPAAPAARRSSTCSTPTPPSATSGKGESSSAASVNILSPTGGPYARFEGVSKTGPKTAKSAPPARAARASSMLCAETPIKSSLPKARRTTPASSEFVVKWTPSQPAARAMSARSLTRTRVALPRVRCAAAEANSKRTRPSNSFSRSWTSVTRASTAARTSASRRRNSSDSGPVALFVSPPVMRYVIGRASARGILYLGRYRREYVGGRESGANDSGFAGFELRLVRQRVGALKFAHGLVEVEYLPEGHREIEQANARHGAAHPSRGDRVLEPHQTRLLRDHDEEEVVAPVAHPQRLPPRQQRQKDAGLQAQEDVEDNREPRSHKW